MAHLATIFTYWFLDARKINATIFKVTIMSMNKISLAIAGLMISAAPVMAADAIMNEPMPTPPPVEAADWSGLWIGAGVGYGMARHEVEGGYLAEELYACFNPVIIDGYIEDCEDGEDLGGALAFAESDGLGGEGVTFRLGGGDDFQLGDRFVAGVFGDYNFGDTSAEASGLGAVSLFGAPPIGLGVGLKVDTGDSWVVGGRAGFLLNPDTLFYGVLGYTEMDMKLTLAGAGGLIPYGPPDFSVIGPEGQVSKSYTAPGVVMGAGMETRITENISIKGEYRYTKFDQQRFRGEDQFYDEFLDGAIVAETFYGAEAETSIHDFTLSLAYRW